MKIVDILFKSKERRIPTKRKVNFDDLYSKWTDYCILSQKMMIIYSAYCSSNSVIKLKREDKIKNEVEENHIINDIVERSFDGIDKNGYYYKWVNSQLPSKCNECIFLPICQGGCKAGYLGYMDVSCKRVINEIDNILEYKVSLNTIDKKEEIEGNKIYLD